ncbi:hypothetical protein ICN48_02240 [Polynucleobacter sp. JS-Safj-400b-B2]|uniref:hypothetical protein n=1 Tax=Polynucleobacter sp. JS-Safj-400b-B2 TaxID=2576921 RepID=UPI001C0C2CDB|nr:hypothetical protein [Polynucleobacter sp. JS-Safj-400b-B2]MBU3625061.1 hypothetical protein [Polynucleobacter sp. JS-Safj-400b-B2]
MKKLLILAILFIVGCTSGPMRQNYQAMMNEEVESPFFYIPPLNQKDYSDRTWILLAESKTKVWFYDPYSLTEDEDGVLTYDAFIAPRAKSNLATYNATMVGPYRQKIDCFSNHQWSETLYTQNIVSQRPLVGDTKPVNGSGWVKIAPRTAMAYVRSRLCGRKFIDDQNINYFLYQDGALPAPIAQKAPVEVFDEKEKKQLTNAKQDATLGSTNSKPPVFYEVINNEVSIVDAKKDVRQMKLSSYVLSRDFTKEADYIFMANCQENSYALMTQGQKEKSRGAISAVGAIGAKDSMSAVAFNRACGDHGAYMKLANKSGR